jgi:hypothetical protein
MEMSSVPINEYAIGQMLGELSQQIKAMRGETDQHHVDNSTRLEAIERRLIISEARIESLWLFKSKLVWMGTLVITIGTVATHVLVDSASLIFHSGAIK